jgi:glycolate oxidase FAD binding subunit
VSATGVSLGVVRDLRAICGEQDIVESAAGTGQNDAVRFDVSTSSAEEVAAVLRIANEQGLTVAPVGGFTELDRSGPQADIVLHTDRLTQVEHYDHADLTVGVGAGTTVAQLSAMVGADQLLFGCNPPWPERATVGGLLATASHGPLRHGFGAVRDYCIGIRFVTGDGRRAKGGGRVVKNVAGYDLMKLLIGSYGTLAVITSASFKLFPAPRQTRTYLAEFVTAAEALQFRDRVMCSPLSPLCLELVSPGARKLMRPEMTSDAWVICVRAAGSDVVLARYRKELGLAVTRELDGDDERRMWKAVEDFAASQTGQVDQPQIAELTVWPRDVQAVVDSLLETTALGGPDVAIIGRVGIGHLLVKWRGAVDVGRAIIEVLNKNLRNNATVKVAGAVNPWPIPAENLASMRAVKQALDPKNVLRGREIS